MRLAGVFALAFVASAVAGMLAHAAVSFLPDWGGRGLDGAFRALLTSVYLILGIILYAFAIWRRDTARRLKRALSTLLLASFLIAVLRAIDNGLNGFNWPREIISMVRTFLPLWCVALAQWLIIHIYLSRRATSASASSMMPGQH